MRYKLMALIFIPVIAGVFMLSACNEDNGFSTFNSFNSSEQHAGPQAVFTQTNQPGGNMINVYSRSPKGELTFSKAYSTQGTGTGSGLGSQGALAFTQGGTILLAVNAGSNEISVFSTSITELTFRSKISSGGERPISVTGVKDLVYVLNAGGSGNITGFRLKGNGILSPIPNSTRFLSNKGVGASTGPAQISFNNAGNLLVVTEKATNKILSYTVNADGTVEGPYIFPSAGKTPFGFDFRRNDQLIVSEAFGGATDSSAVSSYSINKKGVVGVITGPVFTTETAACWIVITNNGKFTYTSNTGSGTITGYSIEPSGALTLLNADGVTANLGAGIRPIDMALSVNSKYLFSLNAGNGSISSLQVNSDGSLSVINVAAVSGLPTGTAGLLAR